MDRYIDNDETQVYGPKLSANIRLKFTEPGPIQSLMLHCCAQIDQNTESMRVAMAGQRRAGSKRRALAEEKLPVVIRARAELKTLTFALATHKSDATHPWDGDPSLFVPGGMGGIGKGAGAMHVALGVAKGEFEKDSAAPDREVWIERLETQLERLAPLVSQTEGVTKAHHRALSEQSAEKRAWLRVYRGACLSLEGVLTLLGRESEYTAMVPHLNVRGASK